MGKEIRSAMNRREFIDRSARFAAMAAVLPNVPTLFPEAVPPRLVVAKNGTPGEMVRRAVAELGGMGRFVKHGDVVVVKPNMSWDRVPEQGATTNPEVVREVVKLCLEAGAKKVKVFDSTLNEPRRCYKRSGIQKAAEEAGADVQFVMDRKFKTAAFPMGDVIKSWELYEDVLDADRLINVPAAKHHSVPEAGISLGMKNLMGLIGGNRGQYHRNFAKKIVDLSTRIKPDLVILDAYRVLLRNGPSGGNLADVVLMKNLIAGADPVAVDSYGATLFNLQPEKIPFLIEAKQRGLGENILKNVTTRVVTLTA
jgi:uncharacterized protein (DUF362 family)